MSSLCPGPEASGSPEALKALEQLRAKRDSERQNLSKSQLKKARRKLTRLYHLAVHGSADTGTACTGPEAEDVLGDVPQASGNALAAMSENTDASVADLASALPSSRALAGQREEELDSAARTQQAQPSAPHATQFQAPVMLPSGVRLPVRPSLPPRGRGQHLDLSHVVHALKHQAPAHTPLAAAAAAVHVAVSASVVSTAAVAGPSQGAAEPSHTPTQSVSVAPAGPARSQGRGASQQGPAAQGVGSRKRQQGMSGAGAPSQSAPGEDTTHTGQEQQQQPKRQRRQFVYGNYHGYYGYRHATLDAFDQDPRLQLLDSEWFRGRHLLDVGCNEGLVTLAAAARWGTASATGVDIDPVLIGKASRNLRSLRGNITEQLRLGPVRDTQPGSHFAQAVSELGSVQEHGTEEASVQQTVQQHPLVQHQASVLEQGTEEPLVQQTVVTETPTLTTTDAPSDLALPGSHATDVASDLPCPSLQSEGTGVTCGPAQRHRSTVAHATGTATATATVATTTITATTASTAPARSTAITATTNSATLAADTSLITTAAAAVHSQDPAPQAHNTLSSPSDHPSAQTTLKQATVLHVTATAAAGSGPGSPAAVAGGEQGCPMSVDESITAVHASEVDYISIARPDVSGDAVNGAGGQADASGVGVEAGMQAAQADTKSKQELRPGPASTRSWAALRTAVRALSAVHFYTEDWANTHIQPMQTKGGKGQPNGGRPPKGKGVGGGAQRGTYGVILCLSVTKWVHVNWGDEGLLRLFDKFNRCLEEGGYLVLEPQPWRSYENAVHKKRTSGLSQEALRSLKLRPEDFPAMLTQEYGFELVADVNKSSSALGFDRPLYVFCKRGPVTRPPTVLQGVSVSQQEGGWSVDGATGEPQEEMDVWDADHDYEGRAEEEGCTGEEGQWEDADALGSDVEMQAKEQKAHCRQHRPEDLLMGANRL